MPANFTQRLERINYNGEISQLYFCIFTNSVMNDPVTFWSGYTYDRLSVMELFKIKGYPSQIECPMTRLPIYIIELRKNTNVAIKTEIEKFVRAKELEFETLYPENLLRDFSTNIDENIEIINEVNTIIDRIENYSQNIVQHNQSFSQPQNRFFNNRNISNNYLKEFFTICKILITGFVSGASIGFMGGKIAEQLYIDQTSNRYDAEYASLATATGLSITCLTIAIVASCYQKKTLHNLLTSTFFQFMDRNDDRIFFLIFASLLTMPASSVIGAYLLDLHDPDGIDSMTLLQYTYTGLVGAFPLGWAVLPISVLLSGGLISLLEEAISELSTNMANRDPAEVDFLDQARLELEI